MSRENSALKNISLQKKRGQDFRNLFNSFSPSTTRMNQKSLVFLLLPYFAFKAPLIWILFFSLPTSHIQLLRGLSLSPAQLLFDTIKWVFGCIERVLKEKSSQYAGGGGTIYDIIYDIGTLSALFALFVIGFSWKARQTAWSLFKVKYTSQAGISIFFLSNK